MKNKKEDNDKNKKKKTHWIIKKDDGSAIFGQPLFTKEDAMAVIQYNNLSGYHIVKK